MTSGTRRGFLVAAASATRVLGAGERINVGIIGTGGMGTAHLRAFVKQSEADRDIQVVAVCDVYAKRKERARTMAKLSEKDVHHDHRDLLARKDVDAVLIATPDHWHGRHALDALAAGKDVYLQKPMTYTIEEARRHRGSCGQTRPGGAGRQPGRLRPAQPGRPQADRSRRNRRTALGHRHRQPQLLRRRVELAHRTRGHARDHRLEPLAGTGPETPLQRRALLPLEEILGLLRRHRNRPLLSQPRPPRVHDGSWFPTAVTGSGGIYVFKDREVPDTYSSVIEYPGFYINLSGSMANAAGVRHFPESSTGTRERSVRRQQSDPRPGTPGHAQAPADPMAAARTFDAEPVPETHRLHTDNFFACVRSRRQPNLNADLGYRSWWPSASASTPTAKARSRCSTRAPRKSWTRPAPRPGFEGSGRNES